MRDEYLAEDAQYRFCKAKQLPYFANYRRGICPYCNHSIYLPSRDSRGVVVSSGYTVEQAGAIHITGCPHCHHTYCD